MTETKREDPLRATADDGASSARPVVAGGGRGARLRLPARLTRAPELGAAVALVVLYTFFAIATSGNGFATVSGTAGWLSTASMLGIIAVPLAMLMIAGDFDLSIGSMVGAGSITVGVVVGHFHESLLLAAIVAAAIAAIVGLVNGLLVTRTGLPSFIVTLAANLIVAGLCLTIPMALTRSTQIAIAPTGDLVQLYNGSVGDFGVTIVWWAAILLVGAWVLTRTRFGNWVLATGGDVERARRAGVPTARIKIVLFVSTALAATFVVVIQAVQFNTGDGTTGQGYVFQAPIVVVIGGVLLAGGYGSIVGVALGTLIYGVVSGGLFYTGWDTNYAQVVIGVLMVVAVMTNNFVRGLALSSVGAARERR